MSRDDSLQLPTPITLTIHQGTREQALIAALSGELCTSLWKVVEPQLATGIGGVVVDLAKAPFLDSVNIAAIIATRNQVVAAGKRFAVANLSPNIQAVFRILKLDRMFELGFSLDQALANVSA